MRHTHGAMLGKGGPGFSGLVNGLWVPPNDASLPWPASAASKLSLFSLVTWSLHSGTVTTSIFLNMGFQMPDVQECSILKCAK